MNSILYISYDGLSDALGQSQVVPYVLGLSRQGHMICVVSFEKNLHAPTIVQIAKELREYNVEWIRLRYHKNPTIPATAFDIFSGILVGLSVCLRRKVRIVHARGYVAAAISLILKHLLRLRFIFDMRGFWPDEKVDGGQWKRGGRLYAVTKLFEKKFLRHADYVVVLTDKAKDILSGALGIFVRPHHIAVIPTCVDLELFRISGEFPRLIQPKDKLIFVYVGSLGTWYMVQEMVDFFAIVKRQRKGAHFLFLTPSDTEAVRMAMSKKGMGSDDFTLKNLGHREVAEWLPRADISLFFIKPLYSKKASCATKLGESLACGLPVIVNSGIGDTDALVSQENIGIIVSEFSENGYIQAAHRIESILSDRQTLRSRCRTVAERYFALDRGIQLYHSIYEHLSTAH
jgi:glycosyltransferase involved in cell wall biosynthesis